jgi:hypothetical protein
VAYKYVSDENLLWKCQDTRSNLYRKLEMSFKTSILSGEGEGGRILCACGAVVP